MNNICNRMSELKGSGVAAQEDARIAAVLAQYLKSMLMIHQWHEAYWVSEYSVVMPPAAGRRHPTLQKIVHLVVWMARTMGITVVYTGNDVDLCSDKD